MNLSSSPADVAPGSESCACVKHAMLRGALGFALTSIVGFGPWAFAGKWFYANVGEGGLYLVSALCFLISSGVLLPSLVAGPRPLRRFYGIFGAAFFAYAAIWCLAWFAFGFGLGEWFGSFLGALAFVFVTGLGFRNHRGFVKAVLMVFVLHSAGYFMGGRVMHWLVSPKGSEWFPFLSKAQLSMSAKLSWGLLYGLGFGAGIGYAFWIFQNPRHPLRQQPSSGSSDSTES